MRDKKRWVLVVDSQTHGWIKTMARDLNTTGQALFTEMLRQFKSSDLSKFKANLEAQAVAQQLERINAQRAELDKREAELKEKKS